MDSSLSFRLLCFPTARKDVSLRWGPAGQSEDTLARARYAMTPGLCLCDKLHLWKLQLPDYRAATAPTHELDSSLACNFIQITHEP